MWYSTWMGLRRRHIIILIDAEKTFDKKQNTFMIESTLPEIYK